MILLRWGALPSREEVSAVCAYRPLQRQLQVRLWYRPYHTHDTCGAAGLQLQVETSCLHCDGRHPSRIIDRIIVDATQMKTTIEFLVAVHRVPVVFVAESAALAQEILPNRLCSKSARGIRVGARFGEFPRGKHVATSLSTGGDRFFDFGIPGRFRLPIKDALFAARHDSPEWSTFFLRPNGTGGLRSY